MISEFMGLLDEDDSIDNFFPNLIKGYMNYKKNQPKKTRKQQAQEELDKIKDQNEAIKIKKAIQEAKEEQEKLLEEKES